MAQQSPLPRHCTICLDEMSQNCGRTVVTLQCTHQFHLDCIGSTFNVDGVMRCPICRATENGLWRRFASSSPEQSIEQDAEQDIEMQSPEYHWCPIHGQPPEYPWCPIHGQSLEYPSCPNHGRVEELPQQEYQDVVEQPVIIAGNPNIAHHWTGTPVRNQISASHFIQQPNHISAPHFIQLPNQISAPHFVQEPNQISASHFIQQHQQNRDQNLVFFSLNDYNSGANQPSVPDTTLRSSLGDLGSVQNLESFAHRIILEHGPPYESFRWLQPLSNSPSPVVHASILSRMRRSNGIRGQYPAGQTATSLDQAGSFNHVPHPNLLNQNLQQAVPVHHHVQEFNHVPHPNLRNQNLQEAVPVHHHVQEFNHVPHPNLRNQNLQLAVPVQHHVQGTNGAAPFEFFVDDMEDLEFPDD